MTTPRVRFAPSPTGDLHVGNARTALFNWLYARGRAGTFILRVEDTDVARSSPEHERSLLEDLCWLGLGWDEGIDAGGESGPFRQSERLHLYRDRSALLVERGFAYPCFCSLRLLEEERVAQREAGRASLYSGRCRRLAREEAARRRRSEPAALRLNVAAVAEGDQAITFVDRVHGTVRFPLTQIGDFVLVRSDGWPSYNFAAVVDDLLMRITHVIRGDDHLSNTPRQLLIYRALGAAAVPEFAHLPLILGPGGAPLSKREGAASVAWLRRQAYPPQAVMNYLALLGWSPPGGQELLTPEELIGMFDLDRISRAPGIFDPKKLDALAARHMARLPQARVAEMALEPLVMAGWLGPSLPPEVVGWIGRLAMLYAERLPRMSDLPQEVSFLFDFSPERSLEDPEVRKALTDSRSRRVIEALERRLQQPLTAQLFQTITDEVRRETGAKGRELYHPMRIALTGSASGPELIRLVPLIEEGSLLPLPRPVASGAQRARALLAATSGENR